MKCDTKYYRITGKWPKRIQYYLREKLNKAFPRKTVKILLESNSSTISTLRAIAIGAARIAATHQMAAMNNLARSLDGRALNKQQGEN